MKKLSSFILAFLVAVCQAQERLHIDVKINGKRSTLVYDTGASLMVLFPKGAARLGLSTTNTRALADLEPNEAPILGVTEESDLVIGTNTFRTSFEVVEIPDYFNLIEDGVMGWPNLSHNIFWIDAAGLKLKFFESLPLGVAGWMKLPINTNADFFWITLPERNGTNACLVVDTGKDSGVTLSPQLWREWKAAHPKQPLTLDAGYMPGAGLVVREEAWAKEYHFGPLVLKELPITEANPVEVALGPPEYLGTLGLNALKHLDLIVDGEQGFVYLQTKTTRPPIYQHNRLGAVFVPRNPEGEALVAHVAAGSPAAQAGIQDGDELLKIDRLDVTKWRTDPAVLPLSRFWQRKAGSKLVLTLKRAGQTLKIKVVLREILAPSSKSD